MRKKPLTETHPKVCKYWDYEKNEKGPENYSAMSHHIAHWVCPKNHKWKQEIRIRARNKTKCPYCENKMLCKENSLLYNFPEICEKYWDYEKNLKTPDQYISTCHALTWWRCDKGHSFFTSVRNRVIHNTKCPYCTNKKTCKENSLLYDFPELCLEWDYDKNVKKPEDYVYGSSKKVWWKCKNGHPSWQALIVSRTRLKLGCPYCANQKSCVENSILTTHPEACKYWDYEKNEKSPENYTYGSTKKVYWKCEKGHSWKLGVSVQVQRKRPCTYCSKKALSSEYNLLVVHPELCKEWNYEKNDKTPDQYMPRTTQKVWWKCKYGHEWQAYIVDRTASGTGCHYCSGYKLLNEHSFYAARREIYDKYWDENNKIDARNYSYGSHQEAWWKCEKGHSWKVSFKRMSNGEGCPECSNRRLGKDNNLLVHSPDLCKEWDYDKNKKNPETYFYGSGKRVWWKCEKGHSWKAVIVSRQAGSGCPYCANKKVCKDNCLATVNPELASQMVVEKTGFGPHDVVERSAKRAWWKCEKGHIWKCVISDRARGSGCPICAKTGISKVANEWLDNLGVENREVLIKPYRVDGLKNNVVYEYFGHFWHGDPRHHSPSDINNITKRRYITLLYNTIKRLNKLSKNYTVVYRWEHEEIDKTYFYINIDKEELLKIATEIFEHQLDMDILQYEKINRISRSL